MIMPKCLICKCFFAHYAYGLAKTSETKSHRPIFFECIQFNRQQKQESVAQWIRPVAVKRGAGVRSRAVEEKDASFTGIKNW